MEPKNRTLGRLKDKLIELILDKFSLWNYLENSEGEFIKKLALEKPVGVSLLELDLYEQ